MFSSPCFAYSAPCSSRGLKTCACPLSTSRRTAPISPTSTLRRRNCKLSMNAQFGTAEYWDETAPSMLDFALSGPGWAAVAVGALVAVGICVALFDVGTRRKSRPATGSLFYLRVTVSKELRVELPSGVVANLPANNETVLRETKFETADALSRTIASAAERVAANCQYTLYRADGELFVPIRKFPRTLDAEGAPGWKTNGPEIADDGGGDARWAEYEQLGSFGDIEAEWKSVVGKLGGVVRETKESIAKDACKLCNGSGRRKCTTCMGASAGSAGKCEKCLNGLVTCDWCDGAGRAV